MVAATPRDRPRSRITESCMFQYFQRTPKQKHYYIVCKCCLMNYMKNPTATKPTRYKSYAATERSHFNSCVYIREAMSNGRGAPISPTRAPLWEISSPPRRSEPFANSMLSSATTEQLQNSRIDTTARAQTRTHVARSLTDGDEDEVARDRARLSHPWTQEEVDELIRLLIFFQHCLRLPFLFVENDATVALLEFLCPGISTYLPSRKSLSNKLLREVADQCHQENIQALKTQQSATGGRVNFLSDVWQNVTKQHLMACQLMLFGVFLTFDIVKVGSRHDGIAIAQDIEVQMKRAIALGWTIGAVVTDNAGQCGRARRILAKRWSNVCFLLCYAHAINNLVKSVPNKTFRDTATLAAAVVYSLNSSSAKWLPRANEIMMNVYGRSWSFLRMSDTRWNTAQASFASLLRVKTALIQFHATWATDSEFPQLLHVLADSSFWESVSVAENVIRPLSFASYKLQRDENSVAEVVYCYGWIYRGFRRCGNRQDRLVKCIEDRWIECEQPLFVLGLFLHPAYFERSKLMPRTILTDVKILGQVGLYYFRRLLNGDEMLREDPHHARRLIADFMSWRQGSLTTLPMSHARDTNPGGFWRDVESELTNLGQKSLLPSLAIAVLSIAVNTATCERLFSNLGLIHTAIRGNLSDEKGKQINAIRQNQLDKNKAKPNAIKMIVKRIVNPAERFRGGCSFPMFSRPLAPSQSRNGDEVARNFNFFIDEFVEDIFDDEMESRYERWLSCETSLSEADASLNITPQVWTVDGFEAIAEADETPFPAANVKKFPQEEIDGLRAIKVPLAELIPVIEAAEVINSPT